MADHNDIRFQAGQVAGQAQVKKDDLMDRASQSASETKEQAAGFLQQAGEHARDMAQGATDAVKNAVGMGDSNAAAAGGHTTTTTRTTVTKQN